MIQEAGFFTFLRTIGIILLVIYGMKFIAKYLLPFVLKRAVDKAQERAKSGSSGFDQGKSKMKVGETVIDKKPSGAQSSQTNNVGDYVEYEEIE